MNDHSRLRVKIGACLTPTLFNAGSTLCANSALKSKVTSCTWCTLKVAVRAQCRCYSPTGGPGSFLEYLPVLAPLSDPGAHGAGPADAFTVVVPSLPGYGFSGPPPPTGMTGRQVARLWYELMTVGLGYERFVAHGSDLGAGVTAWPARDQPDPSRRSTWRLPAWPLHLGRGHRTRRTSRAPSRTGPRRRAATCTSTPPSRPRSRRACPTVPPDWQHGLARRSSRGAALAQMAARRLIASCCSQP